MIKKETIENKDVEYKNFIEKQDAKMKFVDKKTIQTPVISLKRRLSSVMNDIDKYDYESNCQGCIIVDYDKYERHRNYTILMMIGILGLYFAIGLITGILS